MRFIPTRVHGAMDYPLAIILMTLPWWSGIHHGGADTWAPVILGLAVLGTAMTTDFELGVVRRLPMRTHLMLDIGVGALLALSPWLFRFSDLGAKPYVVLGVLEILLAVCTQTQPVRAGAAHAPAPPLSAGTTRRR